MFRRFAVIPLAVGAVAALASGAGAEVPLGNLVASPNPATVGDVVVAGNVDEVNSTCQGGVVDWTVYDPSLAEADSGSATPDVDGNWSISFQATVAGTWMVSAECNIDNVEPLQGAPSGQPYFPYGDLTVLVQAAGTTVPTTATTASSTTTSTAAAAATVTPVFTG